MHRIGIAENGLTIRFPRFPHWCLCSNWGLHLSQVPRVGKDGATAETGTGSTAAVAPGSLYDSPYDSPSEPPYDSPAGAQGSLGLGATTDGLPDMDPSSRAQHVRKFMG